LRSLRLGGVPFSEEICHRELPEGEKRHIFGGKGRGKPPVQRREEDVSWNRRTPTVKERTIPRKKKKKNFLPREGPSLSKKR